MSKFKDYLKKMPKEVLAAMVADFCREDLARKMAAADSAVRYCDKVLDGINEEIKQTNSRSSLMIDLEADKRFWNKHKVKSKQQISFLLKKVKH